MAVGDAQSCDILRQRREIRLILRDLAQHAVDEPARCVRPFVRLLHGLADGAVVGHLVQKQDLVRADAQNVGKWRLQMVELLRAVGAQIPVQQQLVLHHAVDDAGCKAPRPERSSAHLPSCLQRGVRPRTVAAAGDQERRARAFARVCGISLTHRGPSPAAMRLPFMRKRSRCCHALAAVGLQLRDENAFAVAAGGLMPFLRAHSMPGTSFVSPERHGTEIFRVRAENARRGAGPRDQRADLVDDLRAAFVNRWEKARARASGAYVAWTDPAACGFAVPASMACSDIRTASASAAATRASRTRS